MRKTYMAILIVVLISAGIAGCYGLMQRSGVKSQPNKSMNEKIKLPGPKYRGDVSVERALHKRRSVRSYSDKPLTLDEVSQLLWAAQGITDPGGGYRTAPSAGALYPLEVYMISGNVDGLADGVYQYKPHRHELVKIRDGDVKKELARAAHGQPYIKESAMTIVISAVYKRTTQKYGDRGIRYAHMESGHAAQNIALQTVSLELGLVVIGAFEDDAVRELLNLPDEEQPLYIVPVGRI